VSSAAISSPADLSLLCMFWRNRRTHAVVRISFQYELNLDASMRLALIVGRGEDTSFSPLGVIWSLQSFQTANTLLVSRAIVAIATKCQAKVSGYTIYLSRGGRLGSPVPGSVYIAWASCGTQTP